MPEAKQYRLGLNQPDGSPTARRAIEMADAINRAGSTDPEKIRQALAATDLKQDQLVAGYDGVKFDSKGQNTLGSSILIQMRGGNRTCACGAG